MTRRLRWLGPVAMLGVCLALGYVVQDELGREPEIDLPRVPPGAAPEEAVALPRGRDTPRLGPIDSYAETLERPLFHDDRRPAPPEEAPPEPEVPPVESPKLKLLGVVIVPEGRSALIRLPKAREPIEVFVGERIGGWRLEAIETDRIVLKSGEATETYRIDAE